MKNLKQIATTAGGLILLGLATTIIGLWLLPTASANQDYELRYQQEAEKIQILNSELSVVNIELEFAKRLLQNKQTQVSAKQLELQAAQEGLHLTRLEYCQYKIQHPDLYSDEEVSNCHALLFLK